MKVQTADDHVTAIGKDLTDYVQRRDQGERSASAAS